MLPKFMGAIMKYNLGSIVKWQYNYESDEYNVFCRVFEHSKLALIGLYIVNSLLVLKGHSCMVSTRENC